MGAYNSGGYDDGGYTTGPTFNPQTGQPSMRLLGKFKQQPSEVLDYELDFTEWFEGRLDTPVSFTAVSVGGAEIVGQLLDGMVVRLIIGGVADGSKSLITVKLTTSSGIVREVDFVVAAQEVEG